MNARDFQPPAPPSSARLTFRAPQETDAAKLNASVLASWPELSRWMPWARIQPSLSDSAFHLKSAVLKWESRQEFDFSLVDEQHNFVGKCGLHTIDWNNAQAEIGYWLDSRFTGRGLMTEAVRTLCDWAFSAKFERLEIRCDARNTGSANVAKRVGFTLESKRIGDRRDNAEQLADTLIWARFRA